MTTLYHPRPERWPQFTLRGLLFAVTLTGLVAGLIHLRRTPADVNVERGRLQGTWVSVRYEANGVAKNVTVATLNFNGKKATITVGGQSQQFDCELDVNSEPKRMNFVKRDSAGNAIENKGIYRWEGNMLTICHGGAQRPARFAIRNGQYVDSLIVLKPTP